MYFSILDGLILCLNTVLLECEIESAHEKIVWTHKQALL